MSRHRAGRLSDTAMAADIEQQDLLECVQAVAESHCADPTLVRACMRTASTACPGKPSQGV